MGKTVLWTASDQKVAELISGHTQIFDEVAASDGKTNLKSHRKENIAKSNLAKVFFDYIGNESCDLAIWEVGGNAVLANEDTDIEEKAKAVNLQVQSIGPILPSKPKPSSVPAAHINGPKPSPVFAHPYCASISIWRTAFSSGHRFCCDGLMRFCGLSDERPP